MRSFLLAGCLALCAIGAGTDRVAAEDAPTAVFLLDSSGSMWGNQEADSTAKYDAARDALRQLLPRLRPDARLGLAAFGHRRRGSCADAEVIVAPQPGNLEQLLTTLARLNAAGKGPVAMGLREAAAAIGSATPATIVLIHDDIDNCGQDVCAVATEIAKANPRLTVHAIGLGLDKPRLQQMSCLARTTGGKLYNAQDSAGIASALEQIAKLAHLDAPGGGEPEKSERPADSAAKAPEQAQPGLYLSAGLGPESATLESPVRWRVKKSGADGEIVREAKAPSLAEQLPPGSYDVEARLGLAAAHETVDVAANAPTPLRINLNAGVLRMLARATKDGAPLTGPVFTVTAVGEDAKPNTAPLWIGREAQPEIVLPAGDYLVSVENGLARQQQTVKIAPATGTTFDAILATGRLELSASRGPDAAEPMSDGVTFTIYEDDPDAPGGRREVIRSATAAPAFTLPAGTYYVSARTAGAEARDQVALGPGDVVKRTLPLSLARVQLSATLDGKPAPDDLALVYTVSRLDKEPREVVRTTAKEPTLELSAGRYRIDATVNATNVRAATEITLMPGQTQKAALKLEAGHITLRLATDQSSSGDIYWEIKDAEQRTILRTSQTQPKALLGPGRYVVMTETRNGQLTSTFEVKAGESRTVDIRG